MQRHWPWMLVAASLLSAQPAEAGPISWVRALFKAGAVAKPGKAAKAVVGAVAVTKAARVAKGLSVSKAAGSCLKAAKITKGRALVYVAKDGKTVKYFTRGIDAPVLVSKPGELGEALAKLRKKIKAADGSELKGIDLHVEDDLLETVGKAARASDDHVLLANLDSPSWETRALSKSDPTRVAPVKEGFLVKAAQERLSLLTYRRLQTAKHRRDQTRVLSGFGAEDQKRFKASLEALGELYSSSADDLEGELQPGRIAVVLARRSTPGHFTFRGKDHLLGEQKGLVGPATKNQSALLVVILDPQASEKATSELLGRLQGGLKSATTLTELAGALSVEGEQLVAANPGSKGAYLSFVPAPRAEGAPPHPISEAVLFVPDELLDTWEQGNDGKNHSWEWVVCCGGPIAAVLLFAALGGLAQKLGYEPSSKGTS